MAQILHLVTDPRSHYDTTGGGRNITQIWGDGKVKLDYNLSDENTDASLFDRFGRLKTMDIRKMTSPPTTIHKYEYGYDANGNRTFAIVGQKAPGGSTLTADRSYIYGYDKLNRLVDAGRGRIDITSSPPSFDPGSSSEKGPHCVCTYDGVLNRVRTASPR